MLAIEPFMVELAENLELVEEDGRSVFRGWCKTEGSGPAAPRMPFRVEDEETAEIVALTAAAGRLMRVEEGQMFVIDGPDALGRSGPTVGLQVDGARVLY